MTKTLKGVLKGLMFALEGYVGAFREDTHFRINLILSLLGTFLSLILLDGCLRIVVALVNYLVLAFELLNTALERAVDTATSEFKPTAKLSKDAASAAVLTVGVFALICDFLFLLPQILRRL